MVTFDPAWPGGWRNVRGLLLLARAFVETLSLRGHVRILRVGKGIDRPDYPHDGVSRTYELELGNCRVLLLIGFCSWR